MINLLPIGSIVKLNGGQKRLLIYGRLQKQEENDKIWDYIGCLYPEGHISPENSYLFDHTNIETIYFKGYEDNEEEEYKKYMEQEFKKLKRDLLIEEVL